MTAMSSRQFMRSRRRHGALEAFPSQEHAQRATEIAPLEAGDGQDGEAARIALEHVLREIDRADSRVRTSGCGDLAGRAEASVERSEGARQCRHAVRDEIAESGRMGDDDEDVPEASAIRELLGEIGGGLLPETPNAIDRPRP